MRILTDRMNLDAKFMTYKKKIDPTNLELISENDIPTKKHQNGMLWESIFDNIPQGQAAKFQPEDVNIASIRAALKRFKRKGKFKNMYVTGRKIAKNKFISYVVNPNEE